MKKALSLFFALLFAVTILLSFSSEVRTALNGQTNGPAYSTVVPIPPPEYPKPKGL